MRNNYTPLENYTFVNKKIEKYRQVIKVLYFISVIISALIIFSQVIDRIITGEWWMWKDLESDKEWNIIFGYFALIVIVLMIGMENAIGSRVLRKIDYAKIHECVEIKGIADLNKPKLRVLSGQDKVIICMSLIIDFGGSFFFAMVYSTFFTDGNFPIIWGRYLGTLFVAHFFLYLTIIFYFLSSKAKKKELLKGLPKYLENEKQAIIAKQKIEKAAKDKKYSQELLEQCGMKFFIKYYSKVKRLPLRDIEVDENYSLDERNERLAATKKIIDNDLTNLAIDNILKNYSDILTEQELNIAKSIKVNLERGE